MSERLCYVCEGGDCTERGSGEIYEKLKELLAEHDPHEERVRVRGVWVRLQRGGVPRSRLLQPGGGEGSARDRGAHREGRRAGASSHRRGRARRRGSALADPGLAVLAMRAFRGFAVVCIALLA